jgi:hypothetical protein
MTEFFSYESKAGIPIYHEGKKIESEDALVDGMEVFWLVFEEGFWGHRGGVNHRAIRRTTS